MSGGRGARRVYSGGGAPRRLRYQRTYAQILRDEHVAAWVICWCNEQDTGFHDHDLSGAFGAADIHRVRHAGAEPAISLHAYSPPLWRMGAYEIAETGELRRHSLSYAEELKPLD
jgi:hypothetical protein